MEIRHLALVHAVAQPVKSNASPWDWEAAYEMPNLGIASTLAAVASWLASKFARPTGPALRAAHA